ncbi:hypothetical protein MVEN_00606300 [Mycena venus]|uniref:Uncharacterized protein n=1 Tax=Mycena venus TaxID=2733690 RepID=A0A8H7D8E4_9AGAR|nr:hypothetical protein MVEN_00606300 [Mycena venus]
MAKSPAIADSPACQPPTQKHAHVIICLEKLREQSHLPPSKNRPSAAALYGAITAALRPLFSNMAHEKLFLAGVKWTKNQNIALHPGTEGGTAKFLAGHSKTIWSAIRPLLGVTEDCEPPAFDTDDKWHSVVFHGVPMPACRADTIKFFAQHRDLIEGWVTSPASQGTLREYSVLCRPGDLEKKQSIALRMSFSSEADADRLVKNGGYIFGAACRVSRYVPKTRSPSPTLHD